MKVSAQSNDEAIALQRVQNSGQWLSLDVQAAETVEVNGNPLTDTFITLTIPVAGQDDETIVYKLEDMDGTLKKLTRTDEVAGTKYLVADHIDSEGTSATYYQDERKLTVNITAVSRSTSVTKQYQVTQRIDSDEEAG